MKHLRVCIDARLVSGEVGGIEQFIIGLASGLSGLTDGSEEYLFLVYPETKAWIMPFLNGPCKILEDSKFANETVMRRVIKQNYRRLIILTNAITPVSWHRSVPQLVSNGIVENADVDVMHFTMQQQAFLTIVPSIYHPHDLQHVHLPEYFPLRTRVARDQTYLTFCKQASIVAVASNYVKKDLIEHFHLSPEKIKVIPLAPVVDSYVNPQSDDLADIQKKYLLPQDFLFYPAQTWPHKNHIGLLKALAILRDKSGLRINMVFSGGKQKYYDTIMKWVKEYKLSEQVRFLGYVTPSDLRGLYILCQGVVIPTKFEAASFPLWEAFTLGVPVACSNVTSLPEQAGDAALLFDPNNDEEIASQIQRLWVDNKLRDELVERGKKNISRFSWDKTARTFRAHYRRIANFPLDDKDIELLNTPSLF